MVLEVDNQPRYQIGDLFGAELFGDYVVGIIRGVDIKRKLPHEINKLKPLAVDKLNVNEIWYHTDLGGRVRENGILHVGSEAVNKHLKNLQERLNTSDRIIRDIRNTIPYE